MNINKLFAVLVPLLVIASCGGGGGGNGGSDYTAPLQNVAPVINNSVTNYSVEENQSSGFSVNASDADGDPLSYSISGTDASNMSISATGVVTFNTAPDFESPTDTDLDNIYSLSVSVSDGIISTSEDFTVTVTNDVTDDVISVSFNGVVIRSGYVQSANV